VAQGDGHAMHRLSTFYKVGMSESEKRDSDRQW